MVHMTSRKNDSYLVLFVTLYFIMEAANLFVKLYLGGLAIWGVFSKGILFLVLMPAMMVILIRQKSTSVFVLLEIFIVTLLMLTYLRGTPRTSFLRDCVYILGIYLPIGCCVGAISEKEQLLNSFYRVRFIAHGMLIITLVTFRDGMYDYSMPASYALLFWALVTADHFMNVCRKKTDLILLFLDVAVIFFRGSRGALLCFVAYVFLTIMIGKRGLYPIKVYMGVLSIGGVATVVILNQLSIFKMIYNWMLAHGYQSRIMWTLANNLFYDSGRSSIYQKYIELISENSLFGYGFLGGIEEGMALPHNMVLEIILYFGIPIGILFLIWFFYHVIKQCNLQRNHSAARLMIITLSVLISTFFSNELFMSPFFYIGVVMIFGGIRKEHQIMKTGGSVDENSASVSGMLLYR